MSDEPPSPTGRPFRWQALLQRASEAVFVLDRRRRLLFVNRAWEELTGFSAERARGLVCRRSAPVGVDALPDDALAHALTPPPDVQQGQPAKARRRALLLGGAAPHPSAPRWWDIDFLPVRQSATADHPGGYLVVGRILPVVDSDAPGHPAGLTVLPERLVDLRYQRLALYTFDLLESQQPQMKRLAQQARLAATLTAPLLLFGEPGTGKQTLARILHARGSRREEAFVALDCRLLPPAAVATLLLREEPASTRLQPGLVYLASPQLLPRDLQKSISDRLLHESAGGPRWVAGFTQDPEEALRAGQLLDALYWKWSLFRLDLAPLRQRQADLPRLVERLLVEQPSDEKRVCRGLTEAAWEVVRAYPWPGNLRELRHVLGEAIARASGEWIDAAELPSSLRMARLLETERAPRSRPLDLERLMESVEARLIDLALRQANGNRTRAAELLGIHRPRLLRRMDALGLGDEASDPPAED